MGPLADRKALVTGASSGIGAATARALAAAGAEVALVARRKERLAEVARACPGSRSIELDVRDAGAMERGLAGLEVDVLVANAGLSIGMEKLPDGRPEDWAEAIDTNVKGVLHTIHAVLPGMIARGRGDVVLLGSVAGRQVYPGGAVYCATKHAVRAIYEALRLDTAGSGVRITTVDPGMVGETEFSGIRFRGDQERAKAVYTGVDYLKPEDVAEAILWAVTRPSRVNVGEIVMWASAQASTTVLTRKPPPQ
ncbi:MAG TPA: SDR family NAD(P)-dependent oxidoreductase [Thermoanaerobaculia bacterium]|nr:SDR family NAD(P)-dependent oxidoreductase [Thermoanaerobaculia bacterium]